MPKDAPRIYTDGWRFDWRNLESIVSIIENDDAVISPDDSGEEELTIPTKYLFKVDAEAKEAKFKVGDKVIFIPTGKVKVVSRINANPLYTVTVTEPNGQSPLCVRETELAPYIEHNAPKFKVGDRVRNVKSDLCGIALNIEHGIVEVGIPYDKGKHYWDTDIVELFEPTERTEAEYTKTKGDTLTFPIAFDLSDSYWDAYTADLAKEVVLKAANKYNAPPRSRRVCRFGCQSGCGGAEKEVKDASNLNLHQRQRRTLGENGQSVRYHGVPPPRLHQRAAAQGSGLPSV